MNCTYFPINVFFATFQALLAMLLRCNLSRSSSEYLGFRLFGPISCDFTSILHFMPRFYNKYLSLHNKLHTHFDSYVYLNIN